MKRIFRAFVALLALAAAGPVAAQNNLAPNPSVETYATWNGQWTTSNISLRDISLMADLGTQHSAVAPRREPKSCLATPSRTEDYRDWHLRCAPGGLPKGNCEIWTDVLDPKSSTRLVHLAIGHQPHIQARSLSITVPLTVLIKPGFLLQLGPSVQQHYQYATCVPTGCLGTAPLDEKLIAAIHSAPWASVAVTAENEQTIDLPVSLLGYGEAISMFDRLETTCVK